MFPFYERFTIVSKDKKEIGCIGKKYINSQNDVRCKQDIIVNKKQNSGFNRPVEDNLVVAIRVGLNKYGGLVDI